MLNLFHIVQYVLLIRSEFQSLHAPKGRMHHPSS